MNKPKLSVSLFLAISSAYLAGRSAKVAPPVSTLTDAELQLLAQERAGQLRQTHVRFNALDTDESGYISKQEFNRSGERAFARMDSNKDGVLSAADPKPEPRGEDTRSEQTRQQQQQTQVVRAPRLLKMPSTHSVTGMLAMYDSNNDGQISPAEYQQGRDAQFAAVDSNNDGQLSYDEYLVEFAGRVDQQIARTMAGE